jgi:hypothetical protein
MSSYCYGGFIFLAQVDPYIHGRIYLPKRSVHDGDQLQA